MARKPEKKPPPKPKAEKTQAERFKETARQLGVDETGEEFERVFRKIVPPKKADSVRSRSKPESSEEDGA